MERKSHKPWAITRNVFGALFAGCCLMTVIGALLPMSEPRIPLNHMRTAHSSLQLISAEREYAEKFPASGFTCDLRKLEQAGLIDGVLASGEKAGYHYELNGCDTKTAASAFSFTAVPKAQDKTGNFAFCANQEGVLWYSKGGATERCFKAQTRWTKSDAWR
jgi:hypothetical protein